MGASVGSLVSIAVAAALAGGQQPPATSRAAVDDLFASPEPDDTQIARVIDIVIEEGGLDYARERGERYASRADDVLSQLPESPARRALQDTLTYVMERRA